MTDSAPRFLTVDEVLALHAIQIARYGGDPSLRDRGLLESAVGAPQLRCRYDPEASLALLAADYAFSIGKNHPFVDGNKRAAFAAATVFLDVNGFALRMPEPEKYDAVIALVTSQLSREDFAALLERHLVPVPPPQA